MLRISFDPDEIRGFSNNQIREFVKAYMANGYYATEICIGCGRIYTHPDASTDNSKILENCNRCITLPERKETENA